MSVSLFLGFWTLLTPGATAETAEFSVEGSLSDRLISLEVFQLEGVRYVSLRSLIEQSGGAFSVLPTRARVDLFGETAWVRPGDASVYSVSNFSLARPIVQQGDHILIAVDDVADFFQKSFRKRAQPIGGGVPAPGVASVMPTATPPPTASLPSQPQTQPRPVVPQAEPEPSALENLTPSVPSASRSYRTLVIDPGHGGYDTGAQVGDEATEDDIALMIAMQVKARLASEGPVRSLLTRESDANLSLGQRTNAIGSVKPDFVISVHTGTSLSPATRGVATFYSPPMTLSTGALSTGGSITTTLGADLSAESRRLARAVGLAVADATGAPLRGIVQAPLRAIGDAGVPAILVEVDVLTSEAAAQSLLDPAYQGRIADGIARGIRAFVNNEEPELSTPPQTGASATPEI